MRLGFVVLAAAILSACGGNTGGNTDATATREVEVAELATARVAVSAAATIANQPTPTHIPVTSTVTVPPTATDEPTATPRPTNTPAPTNTPRPSPTATQAGPTVLVIGVKAEWTSSGVTVQVYSKERNAEPRRSLDSGIELVVFDAEICAGPEAASTTMHANMFQFTVVLQDNTRYDPTSDREPSLGSADIFYGECVRGWVSFEIPEGASLKHLVWRGNDAARQGLIAHWDASP